MLKLDFIQLHFFQSILIINEEDFNIIKNGIFSLKGAKNIRCLFRVFLIKKKIN